MLKYESYMAGDLGTSVQKSFLRLLINYLCFILPSILSSYNHRLKLSSWEIFGIGVDEITSALYFFGLSIVIACPKFYSCEFHFMH